MAQVSIALRRWWPVWLLLFIGVLFWWERATLKQWIGRAERRLFAYLGDQGPLQQVKPQPWEELQPGLWSRTLLMKRRRAWWTFRVKVLRMDPKQIRFRLWVGKPSRIRKVMQKTGALAAINSGVFDTKLRPLGLFIHKGKVRNRRLHRRRIDGVFFVRKNKPGLAKGKGFKARGASLAFQSAPLLVLKSKRLKLPKKRWSWQIDRRSALCIDKRGHLVWLATDTFVNGLSYTELGLLMQQSEKAWGLGCKWGLNLDGGASTQMAYRAYGRLKRVVGLEKVPVFLLAEPVRKRKH